MEIAGVSLVGHAARVAVNHPAIDYALLSTDDHEIAEEGRQHGLAVPFMRPSTLAQDLSEAVDVWRHAWRKAEDAADRRFELSVYLQPTSPLRTVDDVTHTLEALTDGNHRAAATVSRTPAHYTPHKSLTIRSDRTLQTLLSSEMSPSNRQSIPAQYYRNGLCYAARRETILEHGTIVEVDCAAVVSERPVANIDEPFDLEYAEWLVTRQQGIELAGR